MAPKAIVYVEGNIGAGKSSLLEALSTLPKCVVVTEPVDVWQKTGMLELFYQRKIAPASFQSMVTSTHFAKLFRHVTAASEDETVVCERSLLIGTQAFADVCIPDSVSRTAHCICVKELATPLPDVPTYYVYLDTSPEKCMKRLRERQRESERDVTVGYLEKVEKSHRTFLELHEKDVPIMVLDGAKTKDEVAQDFVELVKCLKPTTSA